MKFNFSSQINQKRLVALLALSVLFLPSLSHSNEVLKCLGREELRLHRAKDIGPRYRLNQVFINRLSSNSINIKPKYIKLICRNAPLPPSLTLLKILMLKQRDLFDIKVDENRIDGVENFKISQADSFVAEAASVFFTYIAGIQALAPSADCLNKNIPAIPKFYKKFTYLQEEVEGKVLLEDKRQIKEIFSGLENINNIFKICERQMTKKR